MSSIIYYMELDLVVNYARSSISKMDTWFISTVHPDDIKNHLSQNGSDFDSLLHVAFKKKSKAVKGKKIVGIDININNYKEIGYTNN